jgi:hypothetical protein
MFWLAAATQDELDWLTAIVDSWTIVIPG